MLRFLCLAFILTITTPALAEEQTQETVRERIDAITKDFTDNQRAHFMAITGSHNLISVVEIVKEDVGNAVKACAKENPDLSNTIKTRHKDWVATLAPIISDAKANVNNMITVQAYKKPSEIRALLTFMDEKRREKNAEIDKVPVTTPEACNHLRNKMDETEEQLAELLRSTLVSLPMNLQQNLMEQEAVQEE